MIKRIELSDFRNYSDFGADFSAGRNVICGKNGQGKSNLLEAVYFLAAGKSYRGARDADLVSFGRPQARIKGEIETGARTVTHEAVLLAEGRRVCTRSGVRLRKSGEFSETMTAVMFAPDDLGIVRGGAEQRRRLLDDCISQLRPNYGAAVSRHTKLSAHKSRILRDWHEDPGQLEALPEICELLIETDSLISYYRAAYVLRLHEAASRLHFECSGGTENLALRFQTVENADVSVPDRAEIAACLRARQARLCDTEKISGRCLVGAGRDDIMIEINGVDARKFGSQGQTRTAALALKLAVREIMRSDTDLVPVLLLDDVLSELDETRRDFILKSSPEGQTFISACEGGADIFGGSRCITIENGALK